jgi:putative copper export protein
MFKAEVASGKGGRVIVMDSITQLTPDDAGSVVVAASHGGVSSGEFALAVALAAAFFNDAGVGKDDAGIAALAMLQGRGVAAATVSHTSARIGDGADMWRHGVISHVNEAAHKLGLKPGSNLRAMLVELISR